MWQCIAPKCLQKPSVFRLQYLGIRTMAPGSSGFMCPLLSLDSACYFVPLFFSSGSYLPVLSLRTSEPCRRWATHGCRVHWVFWTYGVVTGPGLGWTTMARICGPAVAWFPFWPSAADTCTSGLDIWLQSLSSLSPHCLDVRLTHVAFITN